MRRELQAPKACMETQSRGEARTSGSCLFPPKTHVRTHT